jgi:hypothetical protein
MNGDFKGDFSRLRFDSTKQYAALFKQQGRVDLDSDDFEQHQIDLTQRQTTNTDVIGQYGGPAANAGFQINVSGNQILISPGPYYVRGIEAENQNQLSYDAHPDLISPTNTASALLGQLQQASQGATLGMVLQVWQRLVTALDDPSLQEPALGQADTTVRLQTVWRVIGTLDTSAPPAASAAQPGNPISQKTPSCQALYAASQASTLQHTGTMNATLAQPGADSGCSPIAAGGYQGLENQLYRVEIHKGGALSSATFKWSRENASVVVAVTGVNGATVTVASLGPDANLGFQAGQWVELSDDTNLFGPTPNQPGTLYQIQSINQTTLQVTLQSITTPSIDPKKNARMRRWDQTGAPATSSGIPVSSTAIALENGILVTFEGGEFQPGDYWTIPARTAKQQIDWPQNSGGGASFKPPSYVQIYQAPLACISLQQQTTGGQTSLQPQASDCRLLFPSLVTVNNVTPPALHVQAYSWSNDDVITVDTLLQQGLSITFDQPPTCPWSSANFQVVLETPAKAPIGFGTVVRTTYALDPPFGVTVSGNQVIWLPQASAEGLGALEAWILLNNLLNYNNSPAGPARVRIRLDGSAVYSTGSSGTVYLDGQTFGSTATRASDGSPCITLNTPSGNLAKASDFEGWFYLAPTLFIQNVAIQGVTSTNQASNITQVTYTVVTQKFL